MKTIPVPVSLLLFSFGIVSSSAGQLQVGLDIAHDSSAAAEQQPPFPLAPRPNAFSDFAGRVEAAVESGDFGEIGHLYQTNDVSKGDLKRELTRWQPLLVQAASSKVSLYFKELDALPPTARQVWGDYARTLTTHKVTHLVFLRHGSAAGLVLPLIDVDGRLLIVRSDKAHHGSVIEPDGAANGSQPLRSEKNPTSSAAGSRR